MRDDIYKDCFIHWSESVGGNPCWGELAEKWGYKSGENLRNAFKHERAKRGDAKTPPKVTNTAPEYGDSYTKNSDGSHTSDKLIEMFEHQRKDDRFLLIAHGFDPNKWVLVWAKSNVWHGPILGGRQNMYQSKITVRPKTLEDISLDDVIGMFKKKSAITEFTLPKRVYTSADEILEIDVCDLHFGSDANHSPEKRFEAAIADVLERVGNRKFEKIYLPILADIFHYDNFQKTTTLGTPVTTDGMTAYQIFDLAIDSFVRVIAKLAEIAPVEAVFVPGNHDRVSGYHLIKTLEAFFQPNENVIFDSEHKSRKYRVIGCSLVGWIHGDMPKSRSTSWLQVEARDAWGQTRYAEVHAGNYHSQSGKEEGGIILRHLPALTNIDGWHYDKGFVGTVRALASFVWHKELGLREIWYSNA